MLQYFDLNYSSSDHHLNRIKVVMRTNPNTGNPYLEVCYADKNFDDGYSFDVGYAMVPKSYTYGSGAYSTGRQFDYGGYDYKYIGSVSGYRPALVGFEFDFTSSDHHIDQIRVDLSASGYASVNYQDHNYDDDFYWQVWHAFVKA